MAVTVDATKGGLNSNSYATVEEADAFLNTIYGADEWASLGADDKARLLITATRFIDRLSVTYSSIDVSQALNFPLDTGSLDGDDGFAQAKRACIIQAFYLFRNNDTIGEAQNMAIQGVKQEGIGPTNKIITGFNSMRKYDPDVYRILGRFLYLDFKIGRG
jgi:hypothetical protein